MTELKKTDTLLFKFAAVFVIFTVITLAVSGLATFMTQTEDYREQCGQNIKNIGRHLADIMAANSEEVINYRRFFHDNIDRINDVEIPVDFTEYYSAKHEYDTLFEQTYPDRVLGVDIAFDELSYEVQAKYFTYVYEKWVLAFEDARTSFDIPYTYLVMPNDDESKAFFLVGGQRRQQENNEKLFKLDNMYMDSTDPDDPNSPEDEDYILFFRTYRTKQALPEYQIWDNEYGTTYTYFTPLNIGDECLGVIGTEVDVAYVNRGILANTLKEMTFIVIILVVCSALALAFISKCYISRIRILESEVREFSASKDPSVAEKIENNAAGRNEISSLSVQTADMVREIDTYMSHIETMTAEKERVSAELAIAAKMQADMLPKNFPKRDDFTIYATMTPAKEMGGDFYDFFMIDDDHLGLVMADVSGKGVPAAMFMIVAKTLLKRRAAFAGKPSQMLRDINNDLCEDNPSGLFVTAWFGILTLSSGELVSANAGHEYPALMHKGGDYELIESENMPPLAAVENIEYFDDAMTLRNGDRLFLYTDGVPEAKNAVGERFGTEKMLDILNLNKHALPEELLNIVKREVDSFTGSIDPFDDVTMMGFTWRPDGK